MQSEQIILVNGAGKDQGAGLAVASRLCDGKKSVDDRLEDCPVEERCHQVPLDVIDEAGMESFPCSDPPCYSHSHA